MRESMFLSIYRVYNKEYIRVKVRKWRERISAGKSVLLYSIIEIRKRKVEKGRDKGMFIRYIERLLL